MAIHRLKLNSAYYNDSASGIKTFEIRKNDRNFQVGDILELREWVWSDLEQKGAHTGEVHWKVITYILEDTEYLHDGFVCLAVSPIAEVESVAPVGEWKTWEEQFPDRTTRKKNNLGVFCSACQLHADNMTSYCPNCGAKMEVHNGK